MTAVRAVWVFALDGLDDGDEAPALSMAALAAALSVPALDGDFVEQFRTETLVDYGFARYLTDANGMDADQVARDAATLDAVTGPVVLVFAAALPPNAVPDPRPPLRLIGQYSETVTLRLPETLAAQSAQGTLAGGALRKAPSDAAIMGRVATVALLVIFALTGLVIWMAS